MIDIDTHRVVDMINSRDYDDVVLWLRKFPNLEVVSRDGSNVFKKAITDYNKSIIQVTDRFHLLKNLTMYCKNFLVKHLKSNVKIDLETSDSNRKILINSIELSENKHIILKDRFKHSLELHSSGVNKSNACKISNIDIRLFNKLLVMNKNERDEYFETKSEILDKERVALKEQKINEVRQMHKAGYSMRGIARELNMSRETVRKYLDINVTAIHASYGKKKPGKLSDYISELAICIEQNLKFNEIEFRLKTLGYQGSGSLIRRYLADLKKYKQYPYFADVITTINSFRQILKNKDSSSLHIWIENTLKLNIRELKSFINGLKLYIDAVKNAIDLDYNNGLAEGSVNKIKVIKRIMYGRCNFETLRNKVLNLECYK